MDWALVATVSIFGHGLLMIWCFSRLVALIEQQLVDLDGNVALAIKSLIEQGIGDFEPINPVQSAIAQFITTRMSGQTEGVLTEIPRAMDGKFSEP
jgi:hypothetical protein